MRLSKAGIIGERVRKLREAAELNQTELAAKAGLSSGSRVSKIERGESCTIDNLAAIADALDIQLKELVP